MMSRSSRARRRISASTVLSSRAALSRRNSWSARANATLRRRRIAMCPRAVARWVLPTPTGPRTRAPRASSTNRSEHSSFQSSRSNRAPVSGRRFPGAWWGRAWRPGPVARPRRGRGVRPRRRAPGTGTRRAAALLRGPARAARAGCPGSGRASPGAAAFAAPRRRPAPARGGGAVRLIPGLPGTRRGRGRSGPGRRHLRRRRGCGSCSRACSSIRAILVTSTTSSSSARAHAASTAAGP